ncbi:UDP-N-acetylglucosamine 4,6-dehydratase (inverting) [Candidatus Pelagibacter sp. RS39]|uniref:UDP-N-acetylglucosamine 4,6-dehydratase (inverting) n=1 Tax=Candidatus Pelagibacter sp. RS39 TaxID=1977864 RepID=UPI000A155AEE|nr:UDP-N-acetylglucosamine 4,6-dehydratase (inverting) [Candidatus Pelagibacter sp. RS39]ARJ47496.1 UDP-N-acetylglucosamine 4,6-dehydratase (inverting) [Candidatus Pelagibacter sp. RS39]
MLNNKTILITGGTGSLGNALTKRILSKYKNIKKIIIFSRDEFKQYNMEKSFPEKRFNCIRYFLGDVRDLSRLEQALKGVDYVIHTAALKQVPAAEYNPFEYIKTNVIGAQNLITACINQRVKKVIALSTDKACSPINLYGATKLCSDKLFISSNNLSGKNGTIFSVVRYGNVFASRGSVIPYFINLNKKNKAITITDKKMTRFNISLEEGVDAVMWALKNMKGQEILVPKIPSFKIIDLAKAINHKAKLKFIGVRPGEKIHEELISNSDSQLTIDVGKYYLILPNKNLYKRYKTYNTLRKDFIYRSDLNQNFLNLSQLKKLIENFEKK